jgi:hypothetical protein
MAGLYDDQVGDLAPGEIGWLPLDDLGVPSGPATVNPPPGPNAKACSVKHNEQDAIDDGADVLVSSSGASLSPPLTSNVDKRVGDQVPTSTPVINSISPTTAAIGDPSFDLVIAGSGFDNSTVINFANQDEPTTLVSSSSVKTGVNMDVWHGPDSLPVYVRNDDVQSNTVMFTFTEAPTTRRKER